MIKRLLFYWIIFSFKTSLAQAPPWQWAVDANSANPEFASEVVYDPVSSCIYVGGNFTGNLSAVYGASFTASYGGTDGFLAKYTSLGTVAWAIKIGGTSADLVSGLAVDPSGNIYVCGYFTNVADFDPSPASFTLNAAGNKDVFLAKYSSTGGFLWATKFGGSQDVVAEKMYADANGVYVTGAYNSPPAIFFSYNSVVTKSTTVTDLQQNMYGTKYDGNGVVQWVISGGGNKDDVGIDVIADASNVYFLGQYEANITFKNASGVSGTVLQEQNNNKNQVYLLAVTQTGGFNWQTNITSSTGGDEVFCTGIAQDALSLYVTGYSDGNINFKYPSPTFTQPNVNNKDLFLTAVSKAGTFNWVTTATGNGNGDQTGQAVAVDNTGNIILGGNFSSGLNYSAFGGPNFSPVGGTDVFVTAYTALGGFLWSTKAGGPPMDNLNGLATDNSGVTYIAGQEDGSMVVGTTTLTNGGGPNIFAAKLGCSTVTNNIIAVSQTICQGNAPSTLTGSTPSGGTNYLWQMSANSVTWTSAQGTFTNQNYSPPPLTQTTYYRRNVFATGVCSVNVSTSNTISINVNVQPSANAGSNQTLCATSVTLAAVNPTVGTGVWSVVAGSGSVTSIANPSTQVTVLSPGNNSFLWTVSNVACPSATSIVGIYRYAQPTANAGSNQTLCASTTSLAAITPTVGSGIWSVIAGSGTVTSVGNPSSQVTALTAGSNSFVWTVSNGSCPSATSTVTILRYAQPTSNAGSNQTLCASTASLAAITPTVGSGVWSVIAGSGTVTSVSTPSSQVTALSTGTNSFVWTVSNGSCPSATSTVNIYRDAQPGANAGNNQTLCASTTSLAAITPTVGSGVWSVIAGSGTVTSVSNPSSQITALSTGSNSFVWTVSNGSCPSATSVVNIYRDIQPTANAGSNQTLCASTTSLAAITPTVGSGVWSVIGGSGTVTSVSTPSSQVTALSTGTNSFLWTVSNGSCPSATSTVNVYRDAQPTANAGSNQTLCSSITSLAAINPTIGIGVWSVVAGSGTLTSASNPSSQVTALSSGTNSFLWTVSNGSCPSATSIVTIYRDVQPTSNAGSNQTLCATVASLAAINPTIGSGAWSVVVGSGSVTSVSNPSSQVTALSTGTNSFLWTVSNGSCPSATSMVNIYRDAQPAANAGSDQTLCVATASLAATSPIIGSGIWSVIAGSGTVTSISNPSSQVTSLNTGTNSFLWTVSNGSCPSATSVVNIYRDTQPTANAGSSQTLCSTVTTLAAISPTIGNGVWSVVVGSGTLNSVSNPSSQVTSLNTGTNSFLWTVSNGSCPSATSIVNIYRDAQPNANAGSNQTLCATVTTLAAVNPTVGSGNWSVVAGSGTVLSVSTSSSQVTALNTGVNSFLWTVFNGSCPSATSIVNVFRDVQPTANAGSNQTLCATTSSLAAINPTVGSGIWSVVAGAGTVSSASSPTSPAISLSTGNNSFLWTVSNGSCPSATSVVNIYRDEQPTANAGSNQTVCATTATLTAITPTVGSGVWSVVTGSGAVSSPGDPSSPVIALGISNTSFLWTVSNGSCPSATSIVTIYRDELPTIALAGSDAEICGPSATLSANSAIVGTGMWKVINGPVSFSDPNSSQTTALNLVPGVNPLAWVITNGSCPASGDTVNITSDAPSSIANAGNDLVTCSAVTSLQATSPQSGVGTWSLLSSNGSFTNISASAITVSFATEENIILKWTVQNGVCPETSDTVTVVKTSGFGTPDAGTDQTIETSSVSLNAILPNGAIGRWEVVMGNSEIQELASPTPLCTKLSFGTNVFRWLISGSACPETSDEVTVYVKPLMIPNAISPNGDGFNDRFVITSLDYYNDVKFSVYDRWGNILYLNNDYKNEWAGTNASNERLTDDTYYYILQIPGTKTYTGFINVKQNK